MMQIDVKRSTVTLDPDRTHVLARPFRLMSDNRSAKISARIMALPEAEIVAGRVFHSRVYLCGSLVHRGRLVIPYGISDYSTTFATIPLDQVLAAME